MRYKHILISAITCLSLLAAVPIAAADTINQDAAAWFFGCDVKSGDNSAAVTYYQPGDEIMLAEGSNTGVGPVIQTQITKDCTYTITVYLYASQTWTGGSLHSAFNNQLSFMSVTDSLPETYADFIEGIRYNSAGTLYTNLVTLSMTSLNGKNYNPETWEGYETNNGTKFTFIFSTADGYIDNLEDGTYYLSHLIDVVEEIPNSNDQIRVIMDEIEVTCTFDPNAEYYRNLLLSNLDEQGKELAEIGSKSSERENWALDQAADMREQASEQMQNNIDITKNLFGASTFSGSGSLQALANGFMTIYNKIMSLMPFEIKALFIVIPTLSFIGWVIGRVQ